MKENLFKKFISFSYGSGAGLIIGLITTLLTTRILNPEDFGKVSMFTLSLNLITILIIFGNDQSFVRFFYEENENKRGGLLFNVIKLPFVLYFLIVVFIIFFYEEISYFLLETQDLKIIILLLVGIFFQLLYRFSTLVIRMQQKGHLFSLIEISNRIIQLASIVMFYFLIGPSFKIIVYSTVLTLVFVTIFSISREREYWKLNNFYMRNLKHSNKSIFLYSYPLVITTLITWLFESFDKIALRQLSSFEELGFYAAAFKIVALLNVIQVVFTTFWSPVCYERYEKSPNDKYFFQRISNLVALFIFLVAITTITFKDIIVLLLGNEYKEAAKIMPFLVFMPLLYTLSETTVIGINFFKKPKWHILIASISCLVNIMGNWILIPLYGAVGAAVSTAFAYLIFFTLRTNISLKYYFVDYGLKRVYFLILLIALFSGYSIINNNFLYSLLCGTLVFFITIILYIKEILFELNNNDKFKKLTKR